MMIDDDDIAETETGQRDTGSLIYRATELLGH